MDIAKKRYLIAIITLVLLVTMTYLAFSLNKERAMAIFLQQSLNKALEEKEKLIGLTEQLNAEIKEKEAKLSELRDVAAIRSALTNAQNTIRQLNSDFEKVDKERLALKEENINLNNRLQNITKEFMRTIEDLKTSRQQPADLGARVSALNLPAAIQPQPAAQKESQPSLPKKEVEKSNQYLQKRIQDLEKEKSYLQKRLEDFEANVFKQDSHIKGLKENIDRLTSLLNQKENQLKQLETEMAKKGQMERQVVDLKKEISRLESELSKSGGDSFTLQNMLKEAREEIAKKESLINSLTSEKEKLNAEINRLTSLKEASPSSSLIYKDTQEQIKGLAEILMKKELELDKAKKEALEAGDKIALLETKLAKAEQELRLSQAEQEKLKQLQGERLDLQSRLEKVQDELNKQKARNEEMDLLYKTVKSQVEELTNALAKKELELSDRRREIFTLKDEANGLKLRSNQLEAELIDARSRQKKTLEDLAAAVKLNAQLQEKIVGVSSSLEGASPSSSSLTDEEEKEKANALKRKIEVILQPEGNR